MDLLIKIEDFEPCEEGASWLATQDDAQTAWNTCTRGDWMLWLLVKSNKWCGMSTEERKPLVAIAIECVELSKEHWYNAQRENIEIMKQWIRGEVSAEKAKEAQHALFHIYDNICVNNEPIAVRNFAYDVYVAVTQAYVDCDGDPSYGKACADIIRKHFPNSPVV